MKYLKNTPKTHLKTILNIRNIRIKHMQHICVKHMQHPDKHKLQHASENTQNETYR